MLAITAEESFLIQAHALAECYVKLGNLEANKDPIFIDNADRIYGQTAKLMTAEGLPVFRGQGTLLSVFYMFLVLPLEWHDKKVGDFGKLDLSTAKKTANECAVVKTDTYPAKDIALRHFRNALAHGHVGWENGNLVIRDMDNRNGKLREYCAEFSMVNLGRLAQSLNEGIACYVENVIKPRHL